MTILFPIIAKSSSPKLFYFAKLLTIPQEGHNIRYSVFSFISFVKPKRCKPWPRREEAREIKTSKSRRQLGQDIAQTSVNKASNT